MRIRHVELHVAQRVARPRLLHHGDRAVLVAGDLVPLLQRAGRVADIPLAHAFAHHDRLRHSPGRVEHHALDHCGKLRRCGFADLADNRAVGPDDGVIDRQPQLKFGHIGQQIILAEVLRQPAPAIEVDLNQVALGLFRFGGHRQHALERRIVRRGGGQRGNRAGHIMAGQRVLDHCRRGIGIDIGIDHEPLFARIVAGAAIAHIFDQPGKALAGLRVQFGPGAHGNCSTQLFRLIIGRDQPISIDPLDRAE